MEKVINRGENIASVKEMEIIEKNFGIVKANYGRIEENFGTVEINYGQIKKNYGTVIINRGEVEENCKGAVVKQNFCKVQLDNGLIIRDYTNNSAKINQKIDSVAVKGGIKY